MRALVLLLLAVACENQGELKAEAGRLSHAIDVVRDAPNESKAPALAELRALACSVADTCGPQSACVAAYELHLRALSEIAESQRLAAKGDGAAPELPALVLGAQQSLERAKALTHQCTEAQGVLVRQFKLR